MVVCERFNGLEPGTLGHFGEDSEALHHPFRDLYLAGLLGVVEHDSQTGLSVQRFRQPNDLLTHWGQDLPESPYYLIHPALNLFIQQLRTREPYWQIQHVTVGEKMAWEPYYPVLVELEKQLLQSDHPPFNAAVREVVKRVHGFLKSGSTEFARAEIQASADWEQLQRCRADHADAAVILWLEELLNYL